MGHNKIVKNSIIRDASGSVMHIGTSGADDKYYAVIVKCGHVGNGYFIPVCYGVMAKDLESAIKLVKERSRVQRDRKDCVLVATEVSAQEYYLIHYNNDHDAYLKTNYANEEFDHIERRRIMSPELLQDVLANNEHRTLRKGVRLKTDKNGVVVGIRNSDLDKIRNEDLDPPIPIEDSLFPDWLVLALR